MLSLPPAIVSLVFHCSLYLEINQYQVQQQEKNLVGNLLWEELVESSFSIKCVNKWNWLTGCPHLFQVSWLGYSSGFWPRAGEVTASVFSPPHAEEEEVSSSSPWNLVRSTFPCNGDVLLLKYLKAQAASIAELQGIEVSQISPKPEFAILSGNLSAVNLFFRICGGEFRLGQDSKPISLFRCHVRWSSNRCVLFNVVWLAWGKHEVTSRMWLFFVERMKLLKPKKHKEVVFCFVF